MAFLIYTGLRLLLLVAVIGLFHALGMRGILLLVAGFVVSGVLSYVVLSGPRQKMAQGVGGMFGRINRRIEDSAKAEDEETDADAETGDAVAEAAEDNDEAVAAHTLDDTTTPVGADSETAVKAPADAAAASSSTATAATEGTPKSGDEDSIDLRTDKKAPSQS